MKNKNNEPIGIVGEIMETRDYLFVTIRLNKDSLISLSELALFMDENRLVYTINHDNNILTIRLG